MKYTEADEQRFNAVLREIQSRIPKSLLKAAVVERKLTPTMEMVFHKALESETISTEKKQEIRDMLDSGKLSKVVVGEDPVAAKRVDQFVNREINKAIKEKRLPPRSHIKYFPSIIKINENKETNN